MKLKNLLLLIGSAAIAFVILYSFQNASGDEGYILKINKLREEKDYYMRTSSESPFSGHEESFNGLKYYPADAKYRINAALSKIDNPKTIVLPTSDNKDKRYLEYAYAEFDLDGRHCKLLILEIMEMGPYRGTLFLAFGDATSATETYGAGRYLDIKKVSGSTSITLDFNEAYNPYCAYNDDFSCPFPPRENLMEVAIKAGEKNYKQDEN
jgi:uncharacterized protein (DUF1684 family)